MNLPPELLLGIPLFLIGWPFCCWAIAQFGGWSKLANRYPDETFESGRTFYFCSGHVGQASYGMVLTLEVCESGLRMSVALPFRIGHPPVFIPWSEFHSIREKGFAFFRSLDTYVGMPVVAKVGLPIWLKQYMPDEPVQETRVN